MLYEALLAAGFFALAMPFGFLTRRAKNSQLSAAKKWPLVLAIVHTPVVPLILLVKLAEVSVDFEILLVAVVLGGHATGVLIHRRIFPKPAAAATPATP